VRIEAQGRLGATAAFDGHTVTLNRSGYSSAVTGSGERSIPITQITAIEFKAARWPMDGYIRFVIAGVQKPRARFGRQTEDARFDEFAVPFWRKAQPQFEALRNAVQDAMRCAASGRPTAGNDPAAALQQLEDLRARSLITPAEYEVKRAEILGRM